ncbi:5-oxoprolinase subunit C family protein [Alkalibacillus haloalkaliphilus]|uniref:Urea carboxylase n=1 Tax=Alkalibacillus haloalkaliphilus TaxID=94136 RepID=A0A511W4H4_9BACI|nr:biotin-dependent carboxyltransferase family protein [Alkalibacillus haloalkaliphilus]GEN46006.1 urea carboxylase [Alkalibacillus haloalkaliphilus]
MEQLIQVKKPGLFLSIQDLGRPGYQHLGVPVSGAMDRYALIMGNRLLNNEDGFAALEITFGGTELTFKYDAVICITGGDLAAHIDYEPVPLWETIKVQQGKRLTFERPVRGMRAYLCVAGGIQSEKWLGSQSTFEKGKMGSRLEEEDVIKVGQVDGDQPYLRALRRDLRPILTQTVTLRVVASQIESQFTTASVSKFYQSSYVFKKGDRMGCMLEGASLVHTSTADIVSDVVTYGTIQVPANGQPMILLADRQTTGGYTTIGTVISADHWKLAQMAPGATVQFEKVSIKEAEWLQQLWQQF